MCSFYVAYSLGLNVFGIRKLAQNLGVTYWLNWLQEGARGGGCTIAGNNRLMDEWESNYLAWTSLHLFCRFTYHIILFVAADWLDRFPLVYDVFLSAVFAKGHSLRTIHTLHVIKCSCFCVLHRITRETCTFVNIGNTFTKNLVVKIKIFWMIQTCLYYHFTNNYALWKDTKKRLLEWLLDKKLGHFLSGLETIKIITFVKVLYDTVGNFVCTHLPILSVKLECL